MGVVVKDFFNSSKDSFASLDHSKASFFIRFVKGVEMLEYSFTNFLKDLIFPKKDLALVIDVGLGKLMMDLIS